MAIVTYTTHEQVDLTVRFDFVFVALAFCFVIIGITVQQIDIFFLDINMIEEVVVHE
ncbi:Uncharacterised protein [Vibrio cholerae]|nr:Uncharacterised protein [Vibrio cholerae]CSI78678.1 Uncharacterised protein [Vibrio cholerae]